MQPPYRRVLLQQGSLEWHQWRNSGIGASDAAVIMGENRFKTVDDLIREKRAPVGSSQMNAAMAKGVELEGPARAEYCSRFARTVEPACLQSLQHEWLRASVDGLSECGSHLVEIKCGQSAYRQTAATDRPPDYYYGQLQHALAISGLETMDFWCYWPGCPPLHAIVKRNETYIRRMLTAEQRLYEKHLKVGSIDSLGDLIS